MKPQEKLALTAALLPALVLAVALGGAAWLLQPLPEGRGEQLALWWALLSGAAAAGSRWLLKRRFLEPLQRSELELLRLHEQQRNELDARVREAARGIEQERSRLAALMSELTQSVVVCNLDGRVLLYNSRARLQFKALSDSTASTAGSELIGIGRSIYAVLDRQLVAHALEGVQQRMARGVAHPSTQFVTATPGGQLLRVQLAAVQGIDANGALDNTLSGFVLMLNNITRELGQESARDQMLHELTEASRATLANLQAAVEILDDDSLEPEQRSRFQAVVRDEAAVMSRRITELSAHTTQSIRTRWPLEEMQGADFISAALRRIQADHGCRVVAEEVDPQLWLKIDSYSLLCMLAHLAGRLVQDVAVRVIQLRLARHHGAPGPGQVPVDRALLDLAWIGPSVSSETVSAWETEALQVATGSSALSVRDVVQRHGGAFWFERERVRHESFFRILLPLAAERDRLDADPLVQGLESRPEYYDFDLFSRRESSAALADKRLDELAYTVFDTETTGLNPSQGDRILQIGAMRISGGKLRRQESFEQIVDPGRDIPAAGIPIHGITPEMVQGQPALKAVLPRFHAFASDTVLVAHNAAFDMRFLQLAEAETGVRFEQPVLDTLLLSALIHPQQESHRLEAICERLGVTVLGRHTALGDAIVTAEVFLKMLPLLQAAGIHTLGQTLAASQKTYLSRVQY